MLNSAVPYQPSWILANARSSQLQPLTCITLVSGLNRLDRHLRVLLTAMAWPCRLKACQWSGLPALGIATHKRNSRFSFKASNLAPRPWHFRFSTLWSASAKEAKPKVQSGADTQTLLVYRKSDHTQMQAIGTKNLYLRIWREENIVSNNFLHSLEWDHNLSIKSAILTLNGYFNAILAECAELGHRTIAHQ